MIRLVLPSIKYKKSFLEDFLPHDQMQDEYVHTGIPKSDTAKKFPQFIKRLKAQAKGVFPVKGLVPQSVFWLVDGNKFLGKTSIRHNLNNPKLKKIGGHIGYYIRPDQRGKGYGKLILKLGLKKAKAFGIENVLITCDLTNIVSKKVIESQGGQFDRAVNMGKGLPKKMRYWIPVK